MEKGYLWTGTVNGNEIQLITEDAYLTENSRFCLVDGTNPVTGNYVVDYHGWVGEISGITVTATTPVARVDYNKPKLNVTVKYMHFDNNTKVLDETVLLTDFNTSLEELMAPAFSHYGTGNYNRFDFFAGDGETAETLSELLMYYNGSLSQAFDKYNFQVVAGHESIYDVENEKFGNDAIGLTITASPLQGVI